MESFSSFGELVGLSSGSREESDAAIGQEREPRCHRKSGLHIGAVWKM